MKTSLSEILQSHFHPTTTHSESATGRSPTTRRGRRFTLLSAFTSYTSPIEPSSELKAEYRLSRLVIHSFFVLDFILLGFGTALAAVALAFFTANPIHYMVLTDGDLLGVLGVGVIFVMTFMVSIPALLYARTLNPDKEFSTRPFVRLNFALVVSLAATVATGIVIWWRTLQERETFFRIWQGSSQSFVNALQTKFDCCGYYSSCPTPASSTALPACVNAITTYADKILDILFTCVFATASIIILLLLVSGSCIVELRMLNRFRIIDIKHKRLPRNKV